MPHLISRRRLLRSGSAALLSAGLWPGALRAADAASSAFRFFCLNDLHCQDQACGQWLESRVLRQMKRTPDVDFCLLLGDLAERGTRAELAMVRDAFKALGLPVYVVPGNHDYAAGDKRDAFDELFPGSLNFTFEHRGWQFLGLDSTQGVQYHKTSVQAPTLAWLDAQLPRLDQSRPLVAFTHFPMGEKVTYRPSNAEVFLKRFTDFNLQAVLSGHFHGETEKPWKRAQLTTGRCCALKRTNHDKSLQKGYYLCEAKEGKLTRQFVEVETK